MIYPTIVVENFFKDPKLIFDFLKKVYIIYSMLNYLIIAPHADDELLGVGGSAHKYINAGDKVHVIICGVRKNDDNIQIEKATKDFTSVYILPFQDESYNIVKNKLLKSVEKIYNNLKPNIVFIPNKGFTA